MQSSTTWVAIAPSPWHVLYYPIPNKFQIHRRLRFTSKSQINSLHTCCRSSNNHVLVSPSATPHSCSSKHQEYNTKFTSHPNQNHAFLGELHPTTNQTHNTLKYDDIEESESDAILANMWWAYLKAAVGQRINLVGLSCSVGVFTRDRHLVVPHVAVQDIRYIDWVGLKRKGFQGVVFDKDNTITVPYSLSLWGPLASSVEECKSVFGNNIAVFSNSAGLHEYDPDGGKARALEGAIGIKVIKHRVKKPAGTAEEVEKHFGCESSRLIMVGDRPFTDIVYGNRNGFLTILTEPLSLAEEPFIVRQVRKLEVALVNQWSKKGFYPTNHRLLEDSLECVKDLPPG